MRRASPHARSPIATSNKRRNSGLSATCGVCPVVDQIGEPKPRMSASTPRPHRDGCVEELARHQNEPRATIKT
jgi:hypothetical protein